MEKPEKEVQFTPWLTGVVMYFKPETDAQGQQTGRFEMQMDIPRIAEMPIFLLKNLAGLLAGTVAQLEKQSASPGKPPDKSRLIA